MEQQRSIKSDNIRPSCSSVLTTTMQRLTQCVGSVILPSLAHTGPYPVAGILQRSIPRSYVRKERHLEQSRSGARNRVRYCQATATEAMHAAAPPQAAIVAAWRLTTPRVTPPRNSDTLGAVMHPPGQYFCAPIVHAAGDTDIVWPRSTRPARKANPHVVRRRQGDRGRPGRPSRPLGRR